MTAVRRVLSVDDVPDSTAAITGSLRDAGVEVEDVVTIEEAVSRVASTDYDLILLDARVPSGHSLDVDGGPAFIKRLKAGLDHRRNADTPFVVLSSFVHEIDIEGLIHLPGFLGVLNKSAITANLLEEILGLPIALTEIEDPGEYVVEDLLVSYRGARPDGQVGFTVPAWPGEEEVLVTISDLPDDISAELGWGELPFYVWARVNIAASSFNSVRPRSFRLYTGGDEDLDLFDNGDHDKRAQG